MTGCPVCGSAETRSTVTRARLPTMQNAVHREQRLARAARAGQFSLSACRACGFAWNSVFDSSRLEYDDSYDNAVPSAVMDRYYDELALELGQRYGLERGYVVDIGCGNGRFLSAIARVWPSSQGLGVDPALPSDSVVADGRIRLVKGVFNDRLLETAPSLVVCRHVLEHMPAPVEFIGDLRTALGAREGEPLFVEVPDLEWIIRNDVFWDFCYEHCNYFTESSLRVALARAGFSVARTRLGFGDQYRWMEAVSAPAGAASVARPPEQTREDGGSAALRPAAVADALASYADSERGRIDVLRARLRELRAAGLAIAVWGMATKGVMFTLLVDPGGELIDAAVDVNTNKQGCFVPLSGRPIEAPSALRRFTGQSLTVIVMNTNYAAEIRGLCRAEGIAAEFLSASGVAV